SPPPRPTLKKRSFMSRFARFVLGVVALVLIAGVVAGAVIALTDRAASVKVREWTENSVRDTTQDLKDYIRENTQ
ncbi:MAG: hypothetical protein ACSLFI_04815, partial [Solirubrobacterales bacterium]